MIKISVRQIGNSAGIILPKEALARLHIRTGDEVFLIETPSGYEVTPYDPEFEAQLKSAQKGMRAYRHTLRELAK
jgi:putative addiction module antidote